jgi:hypothetical protein
MKPFRQAPTASRLSITWLTVFVSASAILLLLDLLGVQTLVWSLYLVNPIAWLSNLTGLTGLAPGFLVGMHKSVESLPVLIGIPVIGSLAVWLLLSLSWRRWRAFHFLLFVVAGSTALQFTMQRAYLSLADRYQTRNEIRRASAALEKVLYVAEKTDTPGVLEKGRALIEVSVRLARLQDQKPAARGTPPIPPIKFRVASVTVTMESDHQPLVYPQLAEKHPWFTSYKQTLAAIVNDFDLKSFDRLNILDLRLIAGMSVASALGIERRMIGSHYKEEVAPFLSQPLPLTVRIHRSLQDLANQVARSAQDILAEPGRDGEIIAFFDRRSASLHIAVPDEVYRDKVVGSMTELLEKAEFGSASVAGYKFLTTKLHAPLAHELWHFAARPIPFFEGLPAALEEGMASFAQFVSEAVSQAVTENPSLMEGILQGKFRDPAREEQLKRHARFCPKNAIDYQKKILDAAQHEKVVSTRLLLSLSSSSLHARPDVTLLYAEGWVLWTLIWIDRKLLPLVLEHVSRLSATGDTESREERAFWSDLDREMVEAARMICK